MCGVQYNMRTHSENYAAISTYPFSQLKKKKKKKKKTSGEKTFFGGQSIYLQS